MSENWNHPAWHAAIFGATGTGKSTLFRQLLKKEKAKRKFYYDHQGEFSGRWKMASCHDLDGLCRATEAGGDIVFVPQKMFPGDAEGGFLFFCDYIFTLQAHCQGRALLICDEMHKLCFQDDPWEVKNLMDTGRHFEIDTFYIAHGANQIHGMIQNQLNLVYVFRQANKNAIEPLKDIGFDGKEVASLKRGQWLFRNLDTGEAATGGKAF